MVKISQQEYNNLFGPTVGDKIRLGNTDLYVEIEKDLRGYGDVYGGGKTLRDGIALANTSTSEEGALDMVITNVTIIDAVQGVVKADVGIKDGRIVGIGKSGNPNIMSGVDPDLITGAATDAISGEHLILTAGGIDGHVHMIAPPAGLFGIEQRHHYPLRRRCRSLGRQQRHHHHLGQMEHRADPQGL